MPGSLHKQMFHVHMSMASTSLSSVLFTSRPITAALSKRQFQAWLLFLSLFWVLGIRTCLGTLDGARVSRRSWKFTAIELNLLPHHNDPQVFDNVQHSGVARIDLLADNNALPVQVQELGSSIMLQLDGESVPLTSGWCLTTREDHVRPDAVRFELLASDDGVEWEQVGSSSSFLDSFGNVRHMNGLFHTPTGRNQTACFSFTKDHFWVQCLLVTAVIATGLYWSGVSFAVAARENTCRIIVGCAQLLSGLTMACVAIAGVTQTGVGFEASSDLIISACCTFCFAYCFLIDEGALRVCTSIVSCIGIGMAFVHLICFHNVLLFVFTFIMNCGTLSFFKQISRRRHHHLRESLALVKDDNIAHDTAWTSLSQCSPNAISKLQCLVDSTWQSKVTDVHQYQPVPVSPIAIRRRRSSLLSTFAECQPATAQALDGEDVLLASAQPVGGVSPAPSPSLSTGDTSFDLASALNLGSLSDWTAGRNMAQHTEAKGARLLNEPPANSTVTDFPNLQAHCPKSDSPTFLSSSLDMGGTSAGRNEGCEDIESPGNSIERVTSLDYLYETAAAAEPVLLSKVQEWAAKTEGHFHRQQTASLRAPSAQRSKSLTSLPEALPAAWTQFVRWERAAKEDEVVTAKEQHEQGQVRWPQLKSPSRAVQKVYRAYGGDVSHLTDICRQSIVFTDLNHLSDCLSAILGDPDVAVERIKNRYSRSYDSSVSSGYRDVALNLRLIGGRAQGLVAPELRACVAAHVCEVQLILADVASIKSDHGHANYVSFRDLRGQ